MATEFLLTDTEVFWGSLEEGILRLLGGLAGTEGSSGGLLAGLGLGRLVMETKISMLLIETDSALRSSNVVRLSNDPAKECIIARSSA